jgi:ENTH domain
MYKRTVQNRVIWARLQDCKGAKWKHGAKALWLLQGLLLRGPECVLADALQHLQDIRAVSVRDSNRVST